jgi:Ca-activated chloride channel family protein
VPFLTAILLAIGLIVGLRTFMGGGQPAGKRDAAGAATFESGSCDDRDKVALTLISSPEKAEVVKRVAAAYPGGGGRCVRLTVVSEASGATMAKLLRGWNEPSDGARPDVWSPSSTSWLKLLERRGTRGDLPGLVPAEAPSMAISPQVIAMPRPMAEALGWPRRRLGWQEMLDLASDPRGWAAHGHPEWGRFKLGKTNPNYSTSGLSATVGAYFAATGRANDLTVADVAAPRVRAFVGGWSSRWSTTASRASRSWPTCAGRTTWARPCPTSPPSASRSSRSGTTTRAAPPPTPPRSAAAPGRRCRWWPSTPGKGCSSPTIPMPC